MLERIEAVRYERKSIINNNEKRSGKSIDVPLRVSDATAEQLAAKRAEQTSKLLAMVG